MFKKSILFGTSALLSAAIAMPAMAQVQDEIIVTATKRATTLQATPVAVTVTNDVTIERANIDDILDLQSVVPSLRVNQLQSSQNTNFIIRGFGNGANNAGIEPSVGVFIDGVYRSRSAASIGDLPKLQRVEVLKGPQSTLFGKNASAGVVSVVTAKPQFETEGYIELGYGNYDAKSAKAYYTGPISDSVAVSVGIGVNKRDGYAESINPELEDVNDRNRFNLRGQALFQPRDNMEFRLIADYSTLDENCCVTSVVVESPTTAILNGINGGPSFAPVSDPFSYVAYQNTDSVNELDDYGLSFHADISFDKFDLTSITAYRVNESFYSTDADYGTNELLDFVRSDQETNTFTQEIRLTSNTDGAVDWMVGGFLFEEDVNQDAGLQYGADLRAYFDALSGGGLAAIELANGAAPGSLFTLPGQGTDEFFTQSNTAWSVFGTVDFHVSDKLTLTAGANYTDDRKNVSGFTINTDAFSAVDLTGPLAVNTIAAGVFTSGVDPFPGFPGLPSFEQATAGLGPMGAGLPFTPDNLALIQGIPAFGPYLAGVQGFASATAASPQNPLLPLQGFQFQPPFLAFPNAVENGKTADDKLTYQVRAAYEVSDFLNVYASYATGFKSSSWNLSRDSLPFATDQAALVAGGLTRVNQGYGTRFAGPEDAKVIELGAKTRFDGGFINFAVFQQKIKDFQSNAFVGSSFVLTNAGETRVNGFEVDGSYSPVDALTLNFAGTFLDAEYTDFTNASGPAGTGTVDLTGRTPSTISDISLSLGATYNFDLTDTVSGYIRGDFQYESDADQGFNLSLEGNALSAAVNPLYTTTAFVEGYEDRNQQLVNASAGVEFDNGVELQVWARNLFNDQYFSTLFPGVAQFGIVNAYPSPPRTYGINARYKF